MSGYRCTRRDFIASSLKTAVAITAACSVPLTGCRSSQGFAYDTIIKNAKIYDGSLSQPFFADIAVKKGTIAGIGDYKTNAAQILDATGLTVTPGFVDIHTHCDLTFKKTGWQRHLARFMPSWKGNHNYLYQGVTSVITGNCGLGYEDTQGWLDTVDSLGFGTNVGHLIPHGIVRQSVMKDENITGRDLPERAMARLSGRILKGMDQGAFGMSAGLEYDPGLLASPEELINLCKIVEKKSGVFTVHMRDESGSIKNRKKHGVLESIDEVVNVAGASGVNTQISHLKIVSPFNGLGVEELVSPILKARETGLNIHADQYPYAAGSTFLTILLPSSMKSGDALDDRYKNKVGRQQIKEVLKEIYSHMGPEKILITMNAADEDLEGKTVREAADIKGRSAEDMFVDFVFQDEPPMAVFFGQDINVVRTLMPYDFMITASDGWTTPKGMTRPHPRVYGTFPRKLKRFVMTENIMGMTQAIHSMTGLPAQKFGISKRGLIKEGYHADICVFDEKTLSDHATYKEPHQYATGLVHLFVNGVHSIKDRVHTGDRGGRALRKI